MSNLEVAVYSDEDASWPSLQSALRENSSLSCLQKKSYARGVYSADHEQKLWVANHVRPRFWYLVFTACNLENRTGLDIQIEIEFHNHGGFFVR
jgi:hypothetical protein